MKTPWFLREAYTYKKAPNFLFQEPFADVLSNDAKILYVQLLDLAYLSYENREKDKYWVNRDGELFVHCTIKTIEQKLHCGHDKASKVLRELEGANLIRRRSRGNGRTAEIVLLDPKSRCEKAEPAASENQNREQLKNRISRSEKSDGNNTDKINKDSIPENNTAHSGYAREAVEKEIRSNICFDALVHDLPEKRNVLEGILDVIVGTICSDGPNLRINREVCDIETVRTRFYALDDMDIRYVLDKIRDMDAPVRSFTAFCRGLLYEAKYAGDLYYETKFRNDLAAGKV